MQTKNLSSSMPLMPTNRHDILLQYILHICICSVTVNCNCIPGRKARIRKHVKKCVFQCVSTCWAVLPHCHPCCPLTVLQFDVLFQPRFTTSSAESSSCCIFRFACHSLQLCLFTYLAYLFFLFLFFLSIGCSQLTPIDLLAASHFLHLKLTMFH